MIRRDFIKSLALGGSLTVTNLTTDHKCQTQTVGFGWEVPALCDNGADMYFEILDTILLLEVDIDVSAVSLKGEIGFAEVLCCAGFGKTPLFDPSPAAYGVLPTSSHFGPVKSYNPNNLQLVSSPVYQGMFASIILKTPNGEGMSRHISASPNVHINSGEYIGFHMDHAGISVDAEMQVVLKYQLV